MSTRRPRRVSRGYRAFKQYAGDGETRTRAIIAEGTHPRPMKGDRAVSCFEDEIVERQRQRASKVTNSHDTPPLTSPHSSVPPKSACGTTGHDDAPGYRCSRCGVVTGKAKGIENEKRAFSIAEFCERYGIGPTPAYEEISAGRLQAVKARRRTLIPFDAAESWLRNLPAIEPKKSGGSDVAHCRSALIAKKEIVK